VAASPNSVADWTMANALSTISVRRLSTRSASTPPMGARNMDGANMNASTMPSWSGEPPSSSTSHGCATDWIHAPIRLPIWPNQ
jgi:hypothetical protein